MNTETLNKINKEKVAIGEEIKQMRERRQLSHRYIEKTINVTYYQQTIIESGLGNYEIDTYLRLYVFLRVE